eukprot:2045999-Amphidinium_carterae.1
MKLVTGCSATEAIEYSSGLITVLSASEVASTLAMFISPTSEHLSSLVSKQFEAVPESTFCSGPTRATKRLYRAIQASTARSATKLGG